MAKKAAARRAAEPARKGERKWWYGLASAFITILFFLGFDFITSGSITWSIWAAGAVLFFGIAYALLNQFGRQ